MKNLLLILTVVSLNVNATPTISEVYNECIEQGLLAPYIVTAQSIQECGWHYESANARNNNNLFGLTKPDGSGYFKFDTWQESVTGYRDMVQYKLRRDEGYYDFLKRIGYASDPKYEDKVRWIVKRLINKNL